MLYFSLILIASGIFFIIYTAFIKVKKESGKPDLQKTSGPAERPFTDKKINVEKDWKDDKKHYVSMDSADTEINNKSTQPDLFENMEEQIGNINENYKDDKMSDNFPVVLYEDSSNIIDYSKNQSVIDATLGKYKKIKRIGAGNVEILEDGINFRAGKKLFRFDFNRIADIKSGSNFFVLILKGSEISRLFLLKKNSMLGTKLKQVYNKYFSNVL